MVVTQMARVTLLGSSGRQAQLACSCTVQTVLLHKLPEQLMLPDEPYTMHFMPDGTLHMRFFSACSCRSKLAEQPKPASPSRMLRCIKPPCLQHMQSGRAHATHQQVSADRSPCVQGVEDQESSVATPWASNPTSTASKLKHRVKRTADNTMHRKGGVVPALAGVAVALALGGAVWMLRKARRRRLKKKGRVDTEHLMESCLLEPSDAAQAGQPAPPLLQRTFVCASK